jgi:predicted dehydrogenase
MGRHHLRTIEASAQARCVGICDMGHRPPVEHLPHWRSFARAIEQSAPEAVVLAVPPDVHEPLARQCLQARLPVLLEKPLTPHWSTSRALADAFAAQDIALCPAMVERFNPAWQQAQKHLHALGCLHRITTIRTGTGSRPEHTSDVGLDLAIHDLDLLASLLPGLRPVHRQTTRTSLEMHLEGLQEEGARVHLTAAWNSPLARREWILEGSLGQMRIDFLGRTAYLNGREIPGPAVDALDAQLSNFILSMTDRARIDLDTALTAQAWLEAPIQATASISTITSRGRRPTSMVERAGA